MIQRFLLFIAILALGASPTFSAHEDEIPTIAILRFGPLAIFDLSEKGTLDMLAAYGYINDEERARLNQREELEGEKINIFWGDAGFDFTNANLMVEEALDKGADALITLSTPVTQIAAAVTLEMEDPPPVIFNTVSNPYFAGIAEAPCIKPKHITGAQSLAPYDLMVPVVQLQDPDLQVIGVLFNSAEANSSFGAGAITAIGESIGLTVEHAPVTSAAELSTAAEALVSKGAQAFILPTGSTVSTGLPSIMTVATEHGIPLFHAHTSAVYEGATVGAGFNSYYQQGGIAARMLIGHLTGEIDIAATGISLQSALTVAMNLDTATAQGIEISPELLALADFTVKDGIGSDGVTPDLPEVDAYLPEMTLEERREADLAFLAELHCSDEMIAEQKAQLETQ